MYNTSLEVSFEPLRSSVFENQRIVLRDYLRYRLASEMLIQTSDNTRDFADSSSLSVKVAEETRARVGILRHGCRFSKLRTYVELRW